MYSLLNQRRLHDYPYLFLITILFLLVLNLALHQGWVGGFGQLIGGDYVMFYATGLIYKTDFSQLYNYSEQFNLQQSLVEPTQLIGYNPYMNPPYVAMAYSLLPLMPLIPAFIIWSCIAIACCILTVVLIYKYLPLSPNGNQNIYAQLLVVALSFFPFIEGLQAGQNHALTLLLVTGILILAYQKRWFLAGILAGVMIYKPQLIIGLLIVWLVWKEFKALAGFTTVTVLWVGSFLLLHGFTPFQEYIETSRFFMLLPFQEGFPGYIITTLYGFLSSILPESNAEILQAISQAIFILVGIGIAWIAIHQQKKMPYKSILVMVMAIIYPLAFSPYVQFHDLLILVPAFAVWSIYDHTRPVVLAAVFTYLGAFILLPISALTGIAWVFLLTMGLFVAAIIRIRHTNRQIVWKQDSR